MKRIILASASPRRRQLLEERGVSFEALPAAGVDEDAVQGDASTVVRTLALDKATWSRGEAIRRGGDPRSLWVLGCDTVIALDGEVIGKPLDDADAVRTLRRLSGRTHEVLSAVAVIPPSATPRVAVETSRVTFKELDDETIRRYVASGDASGKAGSYGIQSGGRDLVAGFTGCYYAIVGLPVRVALRLLEMDGGVECDCAEHALQRGRAGCPR